MRKQKNMVKRIISFSLFFLFFVLASFTFGFTFGVGEGASFFPVWESGFWDGMFSQVPSVIQPRGFSSQVRSFGVNHCTGRAR